MDKNKISTSKKIIAGALILALAGSCAIDFSMIKSMQDKDAKIVALEEQSAKLSVELVKEQMKPAVVKEVTKEVPVNVTVTKEIPVDNGNLEAALEFIQDNIDEDITMDYIVFETDAVNYAENYINSKMTTLLDDNDFFDDGKVFEDYRKSEVSVKKISDVVINSRDFEDKDVELEYTVKVKAKEGSDDAIYKEFKVVLPFENGDLNEDDIEVTLI